MVVLVSLIFFFEIKGPLLLPLVFFKGEGKKKIISGESLSS
jgi:hypothetical protein